MPREGEGDAMKRNIGGIMRDLDAEQARWVRRWTAVKEASDGLIEQELHRKAAMLEAESDEFETWREKVTP
jgi:hypothetical protein